MSDFTIGVVEYMPDIPALDCITDNLNLYPTLNDFLNAGGRVSDNCDVDESSYESFYEEVDSQWPCNKTIQWTFSIRDVNGTNRRSCGFRIEFDDMFPQKPLKLFIIKYLIN